MSRIEQVRQHREAILALAAKHGARKVRLFGSVARGEEGPQSDIDVLVVFEPGRSLLDQAGLELDLESCWGARSMWCRKAGSARTWKNKSCAKPSPYDRERQRPELASRERKRPE